MSSEELISLVGTVQESYKTPVTGKYRAIKSEGHIQVPKWLPKGGHMLVIKITNKVYIRKYGGKQAKGKGIASGWKEQFQKFLKRK